MALVGINAVQQEAPKDSTLDKIFKGVQIAQGLMGTGLAIPKFLQDREEFKMRQQESASTQDFRRAQVGKFGAEQAQIEADAKPLQESELDWFRQQGVPDAALPKTVGQARGLSEKLIETPAQKESRARADAMLNFSAQAAARAASAESRAGRAEDRATRSEIRDIEKSARLDDKDVEILSKYDDTITSLQAVEELINKSKIDVGPLSGRTPDIIDSPEKTRAIQVLGQAFDSYRVATTGAGAGPRELEMLEKRYPTIKDNEPQFFSKLKGIIADAKRRKEDYLKKKAALGKNVIPFETPSQPEMSNEDAQALQWANANPNDPRSAAIKQRLGVK